MLRRPERIASLKFVNSCVIIIVRDRRVTFTRVSVHPGVSTRTSRAETSCRRSPHRLPPAMKTTVIFIMLYCTATYIAAQEEETKDLVDDIDGEDLERRHRKRKKHQNSNGGCGSGKTFGEKFFGLHDYTYVSAPVMNYFFGCGVAALPIAPLPVVPSYPVQRPGHGGHHGGHGGNGGFYGGGPGAFAGSYSGNYGGFNQGFQGNQGYQGYQQSAPAYSGGGGAFQRPFAGALSAAASGLGTALADYIARPRKTNKLINRQVNQFLKPIYNLF